jgi:Ca2+-binding EF-hand superfamily protein
LYFMYHVAEVVTAVTREGSPLRNKMKQKKKKIQIPYGVLKMSKKDLKTAIVMRLETEQKIDEPSAEESKEGNHQNIRRIKQINEVQEQYEEARYKISQKEIQQAFRFFARNDGRYKNKISSKDVANKLKRFWPGIGSNEIRSLILEPIDMNRLTQILSTTPLTNDSPLKEAFSIFDPNNTGYIDLNFLSALMVQLGYNAHITSDDVKVLLATADIDGDGRISFDDFRRMMDDASDATVKSEENKNIYENEQ